MQHIHIRYFTGTGNSWRLADTTKALFTAWGHTVDMASIPDAANLNAHPSAHYEGIGTADLCFFIAPVYALDLPRLMRLYLEQLPQAKPQQKAAILINGGAWNEAGWSIETAESLLRQKGYQVVLGEVVMMPNNWIPMTDAPRPDEAEKIRMDAFKWLESTLDRMLYGDVLIQSVNTLAYGKTRSKTMRSLFHKRGLKFLYKRFKTTKACTNCGLCAKSCPAGAIVMDEAKQRPKWSAACEQCVRCMNLCPTRAIVQLESIGHGSRRMAYMDPHFKAEVLGIAPKDPSNRPETHRSFSHTQSPLE